MKKQVIYGVLALLGLGLTWYNNIMFAFDVGGFSLTQFVADCFVNHASSSISWDVTIAAITFLVWSQGEARRIQYKGWWLIPVLTVAVALAFAFPLFLLLRERHLAQARAA